LDLHPDAIVVKMDLETSGVSYASGNREDGLGRSTLRPATDGRTRYGLDNVLKSAILMEDMQMHV
jgi:lambda repressor-like predicted transcriptional regulator